MTEDCTEKHALVNGRTLYKRIFIQNRHPLPQPDTDPLPATLMYVGHARFMLYCMEQWPDRRDDFLKLLHRDLDAAEAIWDDKEYTEEEAGDDG